MARNFFPDPPGGRPDSQGPAVSPPSTFSSRSGGTGPPGGKFPGLKSASGAGQPRDSGGQWILFGALVFAGLGTTLAVLFGGMWWRGELQSDASRLKVEQLAGQLESLQAEHAKQSRLFASSKAENAQRITSMMGETSALRSDLETAQAAVAKAEQDRQWLTSQLESLQQASSRPWSVPVVQEPYQYGPVEQNLPVLPPDGTAQLPTEEDRRMDNIQDHIIHLREIITERQIEVRNYSSLVQDDYSRTHLAAEQIATGAEWLCDQLKNGAQERARLQAEIERVQKCLEEAKEETRRLQSSVRELENQLNHPPSRPDPTPAPPDQEEPGRPLARPQERNGGQGPATPPAQGENTTAPGAGDDDHTSRRR